MRRGAGERRGRESESISLKMNRVQSYVHLFFNPQRTEVQNWSEPSSFFFSKEFECLTE